MGIAACGGGDSESTPVEPIEITTTAVDVGPSIELPDSADPATGAFAPEGWPSACDLVPETTVQSIFPQADAVAHRPSANQLTLLGFAPGADPPSTPLTIPEATCTTTVGFSQDDLGIDDGNLVLQFTSSVPVAGDEEFVDLNTDAAMTGEPTEVAGGVCTFVAPVTYNCDTGRVIFSVNIDMRQTAQYTGSGSSEYVVDGEAFSFDGSDPQWQSIIHDKVLVPVVEAAVTRFGGAG